MLVSWIFYAYIQKCLAQKVLVPIETRLVFHEQNRSCLKISGLEMVSGYFFTRECNTFSEQILVKLDNFILQTIWKRFGIGGRGGEEGWWEEFAWAF